MPNPVKGNAQGIRYKLPYRMAVLAAGINCDLPIRRVLINHRRFVFYICVLHIMGFVVFFNNYIRLCEARVYIPFSERIIARQIYIPLSPLRGDPIHQPYAYIANNRRIFCQRLLDGKYARKLFIFICNSCNALVQGFLGFRCHNGDGVPLIFGGIRKIKAVRYTLLFWNIGCG